MSNFINDLDFSEVEDLYLLKAQIKGAEFLPPSVKSRLLKPLNEEITKRSHQERENELASKFSEGVRKLIEELNIYDAHIEIKVLIDGSINELRFSLGEKI